MKTCTQTGCTFQTDEPLQFCPDDGAPLQDGPAAQSPAAITTVTEIDPGLMPVDVQDTRPVVAVIVLPKPKDWATDKPAPEKELREGDHFRVASERNTSADGVDLKLSDADFPGVSSQILDFFVEGGAVKVTGGGTNGFKVTTVETFRAEQTTTVRKGQTVVAGARAPFRVK